jgi:hypothetical protein
LANSGDVIQHIKSMAIHDVDTPSKLQASVLIHVSCRRLLQLHIVLLLLLLLLQGYKRLFEAATHSFSQSGVMVTAV